MPDFFFLLLLKGKYYKIMYYFVRFCEGSRRSCKSGKPVIREEAPCL
jgi:hypothetical protein